MINPESEYRRRIRESAEKNKRAAEREDDKSTENTNIDKVVSAVEGVIQKLDSQANENAADNKRERPWKRAEVFGLWAAAFVGVAAVWIGSHDANQQRGVMDGQLNVMQRQLNEMRAEQRPWVTISFAVAGPFMIKNDHIGISLLYTVKNGGHLPAMNVQFKPTSLIYSWKTARTKQKQVCDPLRGMPASESGLVGTIFPDRPRSGLSGFEISLAEWQHAFKAVRGNEAVAPAIVGCIDYMIPGSNNHHQTGFGLILIERRAGEGYFMFPLPNDPTTIAQNNISIASVPDGRLDYAD